jgi:isovaleryl-CoA dehydrogenase
MAHDIATQKSFDLFNPTPEHAALRQTVRRFVKDRVEPQALEHDKAGKFNLDLFRELGELGLLGVTVPENDGGAGLDATAAVIVSHELSKSDPGFGLAHLAHAVLFVNNFANCANADQKKRYLDKVISGEWVAAMCMTEPSAGTDVLGMATKAVHEGNEYVLTGTKAFITNAPAAALFLVYAKVNGKITAFVVERDSKGLEVGQDLDKLGMRASNTAEVTFNETHVPSENLLGKEGEGLVHMMRNLEIERLTLAAQSLGIADRCMDIMVSYANDRRAFGHPLNYFGQIQRHLSESYAKTEAMRTLIYETSRHVGPGQRVRLATDAAKLFAAQAAKEVADNAIQVLGGYGYCREYHVERFWRDARLLEIGGGTDEAHHKNITKELTAAKNDQ